MTVNKGTVNKVSWEVVCGVTCAAVKTHPAPRTTRILPVRAHWMGCPLTCAVHEHKGVIRMPVCVDGFGNLDPLIRPDSAAVLIEYHIHIQVGKHSQLWDLGGKGKRGSDQ